MGALSLSESDRFGTPIGMEFRTPTGRIKAIHVHCDEWVNRIRLEYHDVPNNTPSATFGGASGPRKTFYLDNGEDVIGIFVWHKLSTIRAIQFKTTNDRLSPRYGGPEEGEVRHFLGLPAQQATSDTRLMAGNVRVLAGFYGHSDEWVRQVGVTWRDSGSKAAVLGLGEPAGRLGGYMDRMGDLATMPNPVGVRISKVVMWDNGDRGWGEWMIWGHQITYQRAGQTIFGRDSHLNPDHKVEMSLADDEYITAVHGCATPDRVHRIHFVTTNVNTKATNHNHPIFGGGDHGESFCWDAPPGMMLVSLDVRHGPNSYGWSCVEQVTPVWGPCPPLRYELIVDEIKFPSELQTREVPVTCVARGNTRNNTENEIKTTLKWEHKVTLSSSLSVTGSVACTVGYKELQEVEIKPTFLGAEGGSVKAGMEVSFEVSGTFSTAVGWQQSKEEKLSIEQTATIPPGEELVNQAVYTMLEVTDVPWSGRLVSHYGNGFQLDSPIGGKFTGSKASTLDAGYVTRPIT